MVNLPRASSSDPLIPLVFLGVPLTVVAAVALASRIVRSDEGAVRALFPPGGDVVAGRPAANPDQFGSLSPATRASTDPGRKPGVKAGAGEHGARRVSRSDPRKRGSEPTVAPARRGNSATWCGARATELVGEYPGTWSRVT